MSCLNKREASNEPPRPEIQEALAAAWSEIGQGAQRRMQENKENLQEIYDQEQKPPLVGHVEQLIDKPKMEDETEQPSQQPSSTQQERSVLLTELGEQITEALQEQERWDQLEQCMTTEKNRQSKEKEASDLDLEAEMEHDTQAETECDTQAGMECDAQAKMECDTQVTSTDNIQRDLASSDQVASLTTTDQQTGEGETDQRDLAGITPDTELQESDYSKQYRTGPQDRSDQGMAQRQKQEREERERVK